MITSSNLGFPRMGIDNELEIAIGKFWSGETSQEELVETGKRIRRANWIFQKERGIDHIPSNDFSFFDHVLDTLAMVGALPRRYDLSLSQSRSELCTYFAAAHGIEGLAAMERARWFDSDCSYVVPEFESGQKFTLASKKVIEEFEEAKALGIITRPVLLGPVSFLLLGKTESHGKEPINLLEQLLPVYEEVFERLAEAGAHWIQLDEPCLALKLNYETKDALARAYSSLSKVSPRLKILLATYFGDLSGNLGATLKLPVAALHLDLIQAPSMLDRILPIVPEDLILSLGVLDGRSSSEVNLDVVVEMIKKTKRSLGGKRVLVAPSCSLSFLPAELSEKSEMDPPMKNRISCAHRRIYEVSSLARAVNLG